MPLTLFFDKRDKSRLYINHISTLPFHSPSLSFSGLRPPPPKEEFPSQHFQLSTKEKGRRLATDDKKKEELITSEPFYNEQLII
jgi:hypothetical protein